VRALALPRSRLDQDAQFFLKSQEKPDGSCKDVARKHRLPLEKTLRSIVRITAKFGISACLVAMCALLATTSTPANAAALTFRIKNVTTGKCLKWNGRGEPLTQAKCKDVNNQSWGRSGTTLITLADALPGQGCMTGPSKREKRVYGQSCSDVSDSRRTTFHASSYNRGDKTAFGNPVCSYLKISGSGKVVCGKRVSGNRDMWIID
jgi:hypothetical protein